MTAHHAPLKFVFAGTPTIAATILTALLEHHYRPVAIYTQPDRPAGRGRVLTQSPVKKIALDHNILVEQPISLKSQEAQLQLAAYDASLLIVVAYGLILPPAILETPSKGCINVHVSLLPRWRGAAPIQHAILKGDKVSGVTIMQMDAGLDTGPILLQVPCEIKDTDTSATLHDKLAILGADALVTTLKSFANYQMGATPQSEALATYASKISKQDALIDWNLPATTIERAIRGYQPSPVAHTYYQGALVKLWGARSLQDALSDFPIGTICHVDKNSLHVQTGEGLLAIDVLQLPGGKPLATAVLLNGHPQLFTKGTSFDSI